MKHEFDIGDIIVMDAKFVDGPYLMITDIDYEYYKCKVLMIGTSDTYTYSIQTIDRNFIKVA